MARQETITILNEQYPSDPKKRKDIIDAICSSIAASGIDVEITPEEIYLSLDEAITNAMEHGNRWDPRKTIGVAVTADSEEIRIMITDTGAGFDTATIRKALRNRDVLSNRGRGIFIISQFCDISWNDPGNQIILHLTRKK